MEERELGLLNEALTRVMHRFRNFFVGPGVNMQPENVPFREREDFVAPLVTVMGHTYGLRLVGAGSENKAVEVSVNVYSDEFDLERTRQALAEAYEPGGFEKPIENFMTPEDRRYTAKEGPQRFASFFSFDVDRDLELVQKEKQSASKVTGLLVDTVLRMRYRIAPDKIGELVSDPRLFEAAVYLYCLRVFTAACRESLIPRQQRARRRS